MIKTSLAIFFISFFLTSIITPSVVMLMDIDYDVSFMLNSQEEEEKEGKESSNDKEVKILQLFNTDFSSYFSTLESYSGFYAVTYTSNNLELFSPPPEWS